MSINLIKFLLSGQKEFLFNIANLTIKFLINVLFQVNNKILKLKV